MKNRDLEFSFSLSSLPFPLRRSFLVISLPHLYHLMAPLPLTIISTDSHTSSFEIAFASGGWWGRWSHLQIWDFASKCLVKVVEDHFISCSFTLLLLGIFVFYHRSDSILGFKGLFFFNLKDMEWFADLRVWVYGVAGGGAMTAEGRRQRMWWRRSLVVVVIEGRSNGWLGWELKGWTKKTTFGSNFSILLGALSS